jgi:23S rRNA (uridine2552-2'-O)-methyltransferase
MYLFRHFSTTTPSSRAWLLRHKSDPFVKTPTHYRARSAYKLLQIIDRFPLLPHSMRNARILDIGCAPGSWIQVLLEKGAQNIIGVDLERVQPIENTEGKVKIIQADFMKLVKRQTESSMKFDLILCDMAPNATGRKERDHLVSIVNLSDCCAAQICS